MNELLKKFVKDERGLETVEWAIVGAIVVAIAAATISVLAGKVGNRFEDINNTVQ